VQRRATADYTIVVRVWFEPHDDEPRARLFVVGPNQDEFVDGVGERTDEHIEHGLTAIEHAVRSTLQQLISRR
jgi:hypothetical protein